MIRYPHTRNSHHKNYLPLYYLKDNLFIPLAMNVKITSIVYKTLFDLHNVQLANMLWYITKYTFFQVICLYLLEKQEI